MIALGKHLRRHEPHGAGVVGFRRDCPICRQERVVGPLPDGSVISPRARATFAIGSLLAGGLVPSGIALADRGGGSAEGVAIEAPPALAPPARGVPPPNALGAGAAPVADPDRGPKPGDRRGGRDETPEPAAEKTPRVPTAHADEATIDERDADDESEASAPAAPPVTAPASPPEPPASGGNVQRPQPSFEPAPPAPSTATPAPRMPASPHTAAAPSSQDSGSRQYESPQTNNGGENATGHSRPAGTRAATDTGGSAANTGGSAANAGAARETEPKRATYVVQEGDCLWRIAARQLGEDANDAAIAKEVTRLWKLNAKRIGTGNPDLIFAGQTLTL